MFVNETEFVRVIKNAWRAGSLKMQKIAVGEEKILILEGTWWKWQCVWGDVTKKIRATIVDLCGFLPEEGERWNIGKEIDPQMEISMGIEWVDIQEIESKVMNIIIGVPRSGNYRFVNAFIDRKQNIKTINNFYAQMMDGKTLKTEKREIYCIATENYLAWTTGEEQLCVFWQEIPEDYPEHREMYKRLEGLVNI